MTARWNVFMPRNSASIVFAFLIVMHAGISVRVIAQTAASHPSGGPLRIPYEEKPTPQTGQRAAAAPLPRPLSRAERTQLERTQEIAQRLAARSDDSFRRGLLPLGDHLRQLAISHSLKQAVASFGVGESRETLTKRELGRYRRIVAQLEQFRQPAAEGWAADLALAQAHLARLEAEQYSLQGEQVALSSALQRQVEWSRRHVRLREFDDVLGMAAPRHVIEAAQFERRSQLDALPRYPKASEYRRAYRAYRDELSALADQVERWSHQGAGIGRTDRVHRTRHALAQAEAVLGLLDGDQTARRRALRSAENELDSLMETQMEFYRNGTASLFELAQTWQDRQSVYEQAADLTGFAAKAELSKHVGDFQRIQAYAEQTRDRRGRIAADLDFIAALGAERELAVLRNQSTDPFRESAQSD